MGIVQASYHLTEKPICLILSSLGTTTVGLTLADPDARGPGAIDVPVPACGETANEPIRKGIQSRDSLGERWPGQDQENPELGFCLHSSDYPW